MDAAKIDRQVEKETQRLIKRELQKLITTAFSATNSSKSNYDFKIEYLGFVNRVALWILPKKNKYRYLWTADISLTVRWHRSPERIVKELKTFSTRIKHTAKLPEIEA